MSSMSIKESGQHFRKPRLHVQSYVHLNFVLTQISKMITKPKKENKF